MTLDSARRLRDLLRQRGYLNEKGDHPGRPVVREGFWARLTARDTVTVSFGVRVSVYRWILVMPRANGSWRDDDAVPPIKGSLDLGNPAVEVNRYGSDDALNKIVWLEFGAEREDSGDVREMLFVAPVFQPFHARLTQKLGPAYSWEEVEPLYPGDWATKDEGQSGVLNAYEFQGTSANIDRGNGFPDTEQVVRMWLAGESSAGAPWYFFDKGLTFEDSRRRGLVAPQCTHESELFVIGS